MDDFKKRFLLKKTESKKNEIKMVMNINHIKNIFQKMKIMIQKMMIKK